LLAFSRKAGSAGQKSSISTPSFVNLDHLLRRLMSANIEMKTFVSQDVTTIKADPGQVEQVINEIWS